MGSTWVAFQPGPSAAPVAVSNSSDAAAARLMGSIGRTPTSMLATSRVSNMLRTSPAAIPQQANFAAWYSTARRMTPCSAPNAIRTPISNVRCATDYAIVP